MEISNRYRFVQIEYHSGCYIRSTFKCMNKMATPFDNNCAPVSVTDSHVHFWDLEALHYPWLENVPDIRKSFGLSDYAAATQGIPITKMIFVQGECLPDEYMAEVAYVSELAERDARVSGIVAYFPLEDPGADAKLASLTRNPLVKGVRRLEEDPVSLYGNRDFIRGMDLLRAHGLTFDLGVKAHQLSASLQLVEQQPALRYMLDHCGKPNIKGGEFLNWKSQVRDLASNPNVHCKLSGLVTEADFGQWTVDQLRPYVDTVIDLFGVNRIAFGGDWPVVTLAAAYRSWYDAADVLCSGLTPAERHLVFYKNALDFYGIMG